MPKQKQVRLNSTQVNEAQGELEQDSKVIPPTTVNLPTEEDSPEEAFARKPLHYINEETIMEDSMESEAENLTEDYPETLLSDAPFAENVRSFKMALSNLKERDIATNLTDHKKLPKKAQPTILTIDDNAFNLMVAEKLLKQAAPSVDYHCEMLLVDKNVSFEVTMQKIRDIIKEKDVRGIILDHDMGKTTGTNVINALRDESLIDLSIVRLSSAEKNFHLETIGVSLMPKPLHSNGVKEFIRTIGLANSPQAINSLRT